MGFSDELRALSEQVKRRMPNVKSEEATKQALILPFFQVLGYDIYDPSEVQPEYVADFAKKKSNGTFEKVDYAVLRGGVPVMLVECKVAGSEPQDADGQLARYFNATTTVKVGVVTNGTRFRFFTDLQAPNVMDPAPFLEFDMLSFSDRDAENIRAFTKAMFNAAAVQSYAEDIIYTQRIMALVDRTLRDPSESFVRYLLSEIDLVPGRVTAKVIERFQPIVRRSIQSTIVEMMTRGFQQEIASDGATVAGTAGGASSAAAPTVTSGGASEGAKVVPAAVIAAGVTGATDSSPGESGRQVVTTGEELELFEAVKSICAESWVKSPVAYKDTVSYFGINLGKVQRWFVRAFFNGPNKSLVFRLPLEQVQLVARGFEVEAAPETFGKARVYVTGPKDVEKLRSLVLLAYEEEVKRGEQEPEGG